MAAETGTMPLLVINMGGEMLYILEQRLRAQSIPEEKSLRVLRDVISTMFSEKFIGELFKPQAMYSNASTRQIFDRLAHSSIMRLNESSMDKLYDLMTMGFKYQVLSCSAPSDLLQITLNHLDALRALVRTSPDAMKLVDSAHKILIEQYRDLSAGQLMSLRQALCRFFQERKVKVSLFLQDQIQSLDGAIIISPDAQPVPQGTELPGTIRYFDDAAPAGAGVGGTSTTGLKVASEERIRMKNGDHALPALSAADRFELLKPTRPCKLGLNLYAKDRKKSKSSNAKSGAKPGSNAFKPSGAAAGGASSPGKAAFEASDASKAAAKKELNLLATMIGGGAGSGKDSEKMSVMNLFPDTALTSGGASEGKSASGQRTAELITFDESDASDLKEQFGKEFDDALAAAPAASAGDGDDLLALMDKAT